LDCSFTYDNFWIFIVQFDRVTYVPYRQWNDDLPVFAKKEERIRRREEEKIING